MKIHKNILVITALLLSGCELTEVTNPYVTEDRFLTGSQSAVTWVNGVRRQLSQTVGTVTEFTELVSDNYFNNYTQSSKVFDVPQINYFDIDVTRIQTAIHQLLEMSEFGLTDVLPGDPESTQQQRAELLRSKAYALILGAELFVALPASPLGEVQQPEQLLLNAVGLLDEAAGLFAEPDDKLVCALLTARIYYRIGDAAQAIRFAQEALANPLLLSQVYYGTQTGPSNNFQSAIYSSTTNQFAPLPRLDFLDPKYFHTTGVVFDDEKPISIAKAEEAFLIIAEAQAAANELPAARETLRRLLAETVAKRPVVMLDDSRETRNGGNRGDYPLTAVSVRFDADSDPVAGLVLDRQAGLIPAYTVSGTSVSEAQLDAAVSQDGLLYLIYLLRQEIFIAEGRRMTDLGIRFPISQREEQNNGHVRPEHTKAVIPSFIPVNRELDDFTYDEQQGTVTIRHDMNKILVAHKSAPEIFPFNN
ncbi:hypothetical protein [Parapedobacter lycopersici]|uniref:hypothetical protein n=1 Tax=Parapedobacter lycopersici TaxID=1864939 RepID=UPI00333EBBC9